MATDGIIKATGNSRLIKSQESIPTTFEAFRAQLISSGVPIDLIFNPEGWQLIGDFLNKLFFMTDATETLLWGNAANRTVNDALARLAGYSSQVQAYLEPGTFEYIAPRTGYYQVEVIGAGGYGTYAQTNTPGGGGAYAMDNIYLSQGQAVPCVVGAGGVSDTEPVGGASSFGAYLTANGGMNQYGGVASTSGILRLPGGNRIYGGGTRYNAPGVSFYGALRMDEGAARPILGIGCGGWQNPPTPGAVIIKYIG